MLMRGAFNTDVIKIHLRTGERHSEGTVNLMAAGERLSPIAFVKRPLLLPAIPPWLRCEIGEASGGKSGGAGR